MTAPEVYAFAGLAAVLAVTPGADMALAVASALGLSAVLRVSAEAYGAVRLAGAAYLIWLGLQAFRRGTADDLAAEAGEANPARRRTRFRRAFRQGLLTSVLNPKVALFYLTLLPQFVGPGDAALLASLALAGIHIAMGLVWLTAYAYVLGGWRALLGRPRVRRALDAATGAMLVAIGLRLAWGRR